MGKYKATRLFEKGDNMEKVNGEVINIDYIENRIGELLEEFKGVAGIEDYKKASQNEWYAASMFINKKLFKNTDILRDKTMRYNGCTNTTCNKYNYDLLNDILDIYIYYSNMYYKVVNITGYSYLVGIDRNVMYQWGWNAKATPAAVEIHKKLIETSESTAAGKVLSGDGNKVGALAYLNRYHSWNLPGVSRETVNNNSLSAKDLPRLGGDKEDLPKLQKKE